MSEPKKVLRTVHVAVDTNPRELLRENPLRASLLVQHVTSGGAAVWVGEPPVAAGGAGSALFGYKDSLEFKNTSPIWGVAESGTVRLVLAEEVWSA